MKERYHIISKLATGGSGCILHAWDNTLSRDVAIKRLNGGAVMKDFLLREARSLYALRHPNIVTIHEYDSDDEGAYLVMEMIKGESLEKRVTTNGQLSLPDFQALVLKTLDAIGSAHEVGIIHRDLKPDNIMLPWNQNSQFEVKLIDFGLSQQLPPQGGAQDSMIGSIHFMAPEQFGSGHVDVRTDLYALGCIYYFALTGQYPFPGEQRHQVITAHLYPPKISLEEWRPELSDGLCAWVMQLMSIQPGYRPASAADALAAFRRLGSHLQVKTASGVEEPEFMVLEEEEVPAVLIEEEPEEAFTPVLESSEEEDTLPLTEAEPEAVESEAAEPEIFEQDAVQPEYDEPEAVQPEYVQPDYVEPEVAAEPETYAPVQESYPAPDYRPPVPAPVAAAAQAHHAPRRETAPPTSRRSPASATKEAPKRRSILNIIITVFVLILVAQFALVSYFKYTGRESRENWLMELSESEQPQGSDVDVRILLDFLADVNHQDQAAKVLTRLKGGAYIDEMLNVHLQGATIPSVKVRLAQILGQRRSRIAFDTLVGMTNDTSAELRSAVWTALGRITPANRLPEMLVAVESSNRLDKQTIEKALISNIETTTDRPAATKHVMKAYRKLTGMVVSRSLLFNVLARVGGDEALEVITEAISDPSVSIRQSAIRILAEYPTHEPLGVITTRFPDEPNEQCRIFLLLAARELIGNPGPSSQQRLFLHGKSLYGNAKNEEEKRYVLNVLSRTIAPGTAAFFEEFAQNAEPSLQDEAFQLAEAFRAKLEQVIHIPPGASATLPAANADYRPTSAMKLEDNALVNWTEEGDWASWLVKVPANGEYEIAIYQSHTNDDLGTYEVKLAGQTLLTSVVKTGGATDFKGFVVGNIRTEEPGIYRLRVRAKTLPTEGELFRVQRLVVKTL